MNLQDFLNDLEAKRNEEFSLEVLKSILQTNNPIKILDRVVDALLVKNKTKLADKFENIKDEIENESKNILDSFYDNKMISKKIYSNLKFIDQLSTLNYSHIEKEIERLREEKKIKGKIYKIILNTIGMIVVTIIALSPTFFASKNFLYKYFHKGIIFDFYDFLYKSDFGLILFLIVFSLIIYFIINFLFKLILEEEISYYLLALNLNFFRSSKIPYIKILNKLEEGNFSHKIKNMIAEIKEEIEISEASEAFKFLSDRLPLNISLVFQEKISNEANDQEAWEFLENKLKDEIDFKYSLLEKITKGLYYLSILIAVVILGYPFGYGLMQMISKIHF